MNMSLFETLTDQELLQVVGGKDPEFEQHILIEDY